MPYCIGLVRAGNIGHQSHMHGSMHTDLLYKWASAACHMLHGHMLHVNMSDMPLQSSFESAQRYTLNVAEVPVAVGCITENAQLLKLNSSCCDLNVPASQKVCAQYFWHPASL